MMPPLIHMLISIVIKMIKDLARMFLTLSTYLFCAILRKTAAQINKNNPSLLLPLSDNEI
eukprot:UN06154